MARKTKEDVEKTYHALLDAATMLFNENGVSNTTLNDIAETAGMTRGAVYWHFRNKDTVIMELWERDASHDIDNFVSKLLNLPENQPLEQFKTELKTTLKHILTDPKLEQSMRIIRSSIEFAENESDLKKYFKHRKEKIYNGLYTAVSFLQKRNELNSSLQTDFITNGIWALVSGLQETHMELRTEIKENSSNFISYCNDYIDLLIKQFE